jgi:alpha-amylase
MKYTFITLLLLLGTMSFAQKNNTAKKGEVIYHVFQRSFYDSDGNRHGDLNGLKQKLPYLQDLGVTSILLLPLYEADCYHNYFANDFEKIDTSLGGMEQYLSLVKEIHKRGMKVYMDMETQYVTEKHLWWKDAVGNLNSKYSDYILFEDAAHQTPATIIFDLRQLNNYNGTSIKITTVNLRSQKVLDYNKKLFSYFVDPNKDGKFDDGVDGFRLDHAMDHLDGKAALTNLFVDFWNPLMTHLKKQNPSLKTVAEQAEWRDYGYDYLQKAGVDRMFGFGLQQAIVSFDKQNLIKNADTILAKCPTDKDQIIFIENHDIDRFASIEPNKDKQRVAASLMLLIGGIPSIYYGQEIGMLGKNGTWGGTDGNDIPRRTAFKWNKSYEGKGMATWYRNVDASWNKAHLNVNDDISLEAQIKDTSSLFNYYKTMIKLKQSNPALAIGRYANVINDNSKVFSFVRTHQQHKVLVVVNLSNELQTATFEKISTKGAPLYGKAKFNQNQVALNPYEVVVVTMQ